MLSLRSVLVFSEAPRVLAEFYQKIFNAEPSWVNGDYVEFKTAGAYFEIGPHSKVKGKSTNPERILLNLHTSDVQAEFTRIKALGAVVIQEPYQPSEDPRMTIATFADPDGNYFQIMTDWEQLKS